MVAKLEGKSKSKTKQSIQDDDDFSEAKEGDDDDGFAELDDGFADLRENKKIKTKRLPYLLSFKQRKELLSKFCQVNQDSARF